MTEIWMARHGETDWNRDRRLQGHSDNRLNARGRAQAVALAAALQGAGIVAVYASDLPRAAETAAIVADALGVPVAGLDPRLRERDMGAYHGLLYEEAARRTGRGFNAAGWVELEGVPDVEPYDSVAARALAALGEIAASHPGRRVLAIGHGALMGAVQRALTGDDAASFANGEILRLGWDGTLQRQPRVGGRDDAGPAAGTR